MRKKFILATVLFFCSKILFAASITEELTQLNNLYEEGAITEEEFSKLKGQIFNVGLSDANISKFELCNRIKLQIPDFVIMEAPMAADPDQRNYIVSNTKIESTGWKPKINLDLGIQELIKGYVMLKNSIYGNV